MISFFACKGKPAQKARFSICKPFYFTPNFFSMTAIKHQFVNPDCNKLAPTNAVNQIQFGLRKCARIKLMRMKLPAMTLIYLLIILLILDY